jgi:cytochrome P450 family 135
MSSNLPPGPSGPALRNAYRWMRRPAALLETSGKRYGDVWTLRLLADTTFVVVSDPELVKGVFTAPSTVLHAGEANMMIGTALLGDHSVILLDEEAHMRQRKLLLPPFHGERMQQYRDVMVRACEEELASWPLNEPLELLPRMQTITLNVIMSVIFGVTGGPVQEALRTRIRNLLAWGANPRNMFRLHLVTRRGGEFPKSFLEVRDPVDAIVFEQIERSREDPRLEDRSDILAMLLQSRHDDGSPMTDREVRDQMVTLLIQGHTSTATALAWGLERLIRHPEMFERLRAEAESGSEEYLDAVFKETLRMRPPLPVVLRLVVGQPYQLGEYEVEVGKLIGPCVYLVHHREDLYPEPERFRPERFLEQKAGTYTWIPFGGGDRHCIGRTFATTEIKEVLRTLALQARLEPADPGDEQVRRRGMLLSPTGSATAVLKERLPAAGAVDVAAS